MEGGGHKCSKFCQNNLWMALKVNLLENLWSYTLKDLSEPQPVTFSVRNMRFWFPRELESLPFRPFCNPLCIDFGARKSNAQIAIVSQSVYSTVVPLFPSISFKLDRIQLVNDRNGISPKPKYWFFYTEPEPNQNQNSIPKKLHNLFYNCQCSQGKIMADFRYSIMKLPCKISFREVWY